MSTNQFSESDPKEEQITNDDHSITNTDDDDGLEKGEQSTEQTKPDDERVPTVTPDNDNGDPGPPAEEIEEEDSSNKDAGPSGENL